MALRILLAVAIVLRGACAWADDPLKAVKPEPPPPAQPSPSPALPFIWEEQDSKSYVIPALEILVFDGTLNYYNRRTLDPVTYGSTMNSISDNLHSRWVVDSDPFSINQFWHPVQGSYYYGFARSAGLSPWESLFYSVGGSALWEIAGETTPPSVNDQIASGFAGSFLAEPLFRMASLMLEDNGTGFWNSLGAAFVSPPLMANRVVFGDRFDRIFPGRDPATFTRWQLGYVETTQLAQGPTSFVDKGRGASLDFSMAYGLPGKPGYKYERPWDYFNFEFTLSNVDAFENIMVRGLLYGTDVSVGDSYRGLWGLYGLFDYFEPQLFRVSNTGLGLGMTGQQWLTRSMALEGTIVGGGGYAAASTIRDTASTDYHYGLAGEAFGTLRLIIGDRAMIDTGAREYHVEGRGDESILRLDAGFTLRVAARHALAVKYQYSQRQAGYRTTVFDHQEVGVWTLSYTFLGDRKLGAVDWRAEPERQ